MSVCAAANADTHTVELLEEITMVGEVSVYDELTTDLGLDSLGMISLLVALEDTFHIELDESDMDPLALQTVADIVQLIEKYMEEKT